MNRMMRNRHACLLALLLAALAVGCHSGPTIDTTGVEEAFVLVSGTNRVIVDRAIDSAREGDLKTALATFREIKNKYRLNPSQEMAVKDILEEIRKHLPPETPAPDKR